MKYTHTVVFLEAGIIHTYLAFVCQIGKSSSAFSCRKIDAVLLAVSYGRAAVRLFSSQTGKAKQPPVH
jgi:hypothetical protein